MQNEFGNRQNMHLTVLRTLDSTDNILVWKDKDPTLFTVRVADFRLKVSGLTDLISKQQAATTGHAQDKDREEKELENCAHEIGEVLAGWFEDNNRHADAAAIDLSLNAWQRLRETDLLGKAKLLQSKLTAALAEDAAALAEHGLTPADATLLAKETKDFENIISDPAAAISNRRAFTRALRPKFREVSELLAKMDRLVLRFRRDEAGIHFVDAWQAARIVRDLGGSAPADPADPTPPPAAP